MKKILLIVIALILLASTHSPAQSTFLPPSYNTVDDDLLLDFTSMAPNRLAFAGAYLKPNPSYKWADGLIMIVDNQGNLIRQRRFTHLGDSINFTFNRIFWKDDALEIFGQNGFVNANSLLGPFSQSIFWMKLDTNLNVLDQRTILVGSGNQAFSQFRLVRQKHITYAIVSVVQDYENDVTNVRPRLVKLDSGLNVSVSKELTPQMYNTSLNVNGAYLFDISLDTIAGKIFVPGYVRLSTATDSSYLPSTVLLHKFDTAFNLLDTFQVRRFTTTGTGYDTFIFKSVETLPLSGNRIFIGPILSVTTTSPFTTTDRLGLSVYNMSSRRHQLRATAPRVDAVDEQIADVHTKAISMNGAGHVYAMGSSHWVWHLDPFAHVFTPHDNKLIVVKYDTSGNLLWHRFLGSPGGYYTGSLIKCEDDNTVTILAARYDYVNSPNTKQRDFYVLRLDSSGTVTAVFPVTRSAASPVVYPNPATSTLHIRLPKTGGEIAVTIYSASGAAIRQATFTGAETSIHIADLPPGVYGYRVVSGKDGASGSGQFLKQ